MGSSNSTLMSSAPEEALAKLKCVSCRELLTCPPIMWYPNKAVNFMLNKIMVLTSPFSSIKGYIVSKPPLVLFTLCLIGFAATTFSFAYYVEHTKSMPNLDAYRSLTSLFEHMSKRKFCITQNEVTISGIHNNTHTEDVMTVAVNAKLDAILPNVTNIEGYVSTNGWISECPMEPLDTIKISFVIPRGLNQTANVSKIDVCVLVTGPSAILLPISTQSKCASSSAVTHLVRGYISPKFPAKATEMCTEGSQATLTFKSNNHVALNLNSHDRSIINLHLFHTSYFLLVMAITLILYAMIKGKPVVKHQSLDKMPLDV
ncbi:hypothetical protein CBL_02401 [Carabus blaptoides fortunei]